MKSSDFITIRCGLQNEYERQGLECFSASRIGIAPPPRFDRKSRTKNFWPVLQAVSNHENLKNILPGSFDEVYSLVFSSKTAIDFFYVDVFEKNNAILKNCHSAYFVGNSSKLHFERKFSGLSQNISCYSPDKIGMQSLMNDFKLTESKHKSIFFTASEGKSSAIIQNSSFKTPIAHLPIYRVVPYQSDFIKTLFEEPLDKGSSGNVPKKDKKVVFECRSAQILEQVVKFLMQYFDCNDILSFPKNIYFSCFGQSTFDKAKQFYAQ